MRAAPAGVCTGCVCVLAGHDCVWGAPGCAVADGYTGSWKIGVVAQTPVTGNSLDALTLSAAEDSVKHSNIQMDTYMHFLLCSNAWPRWYITSIKHAQLISMPKMLLVWQ